MRELIKTSYLSEYHNAVDSLKRQGWSQNIAMSHANKMLEAEVNAEVYNMRQYSKRKRHEEVERYMNKIDELRKTYMIDSYLADRFRDLLL